MMRSHWLGLALVVIAALAAACGKNGGSAPDADPTVPDADTTAPDAGETVGIPCGAATCDEATQECCVDGNGGQTCVATGTCEGTAFGCDGPEDCTEGGEICCGMGEGAHCAPVTECAQAVCHVDEDCPAEGAKCCTVGGDQVSRCLLVAMCPGGGA
jgi:hypothetical protein